MGERERISMSQEQYLRCLAQKADPDSGVPAAAVCGISGAVGECRAAALDRWLHFQQSVQSSTHICGHVAGGSIFRHTGVTLCETLLSFAIVVALGIGAALLLWYSAGLSEVLEPYLVVLNSLPKSALAPLLIVWLGANLKSVIVSGISVAIFGTVLNLYTGFCEVDPDKIKLIYTLQGTKRDVLRKVMLPGTVPLLLSVMKVNIGLCLVGVVIGEFIGAREGLGYLIIYGSQVFRLDWVMMSIVLLCMIAMLLYGLLGLIEKRCLRRR